MNSFFLVRYLYNDAGTPIKEFVKRFESINDLFRSLFEELVEIMPEYDNSVIPTEWLPEIYNTGILRQYEIIQEYGYVFLIGIGNPNTELLNEQGFVLDHATDYLRVRSDY